MGYVPHALRVTTSTSPVQVAVPQQTAGVTRTAQVVARNRSSTAAERIRLFFTAEAAAADTQFLTIDANSEFEGPAQVTSLWVRAESGTPILEIVYYVDG